MTEAEAATKFRVKESSESSTASLEALHERDDSGLRTGPINLHRRLDSAIFQLLLRILRIDIKHAHSPPWFCKGGSDLQTFCKSERVAAAGLLTANVLKETDDTENL